jgi:PAS domain S-box-containing protein
MEVRMKRADGSPMWTVFSLASSEMAGEKVVLGGFLDITRRKAVEDRLHLYQEVFKHSVDGIMVIDKEGRILERNPSHERRTGFTDEDLKGKTLFDCSPREGRRGARRWREKGFTGGLESIEGRRAIPVLVSVFPSTTSMGSSTSS